MKSLVTPIFLQHFPYLDLRNKFTLLINFKITGICVFYFARRLIVASPKYDSLDRQQNSRTKYVLPFATPLHKVS